MLNIYFIYFFSQTLIMKSGLLSVNCVRFQNKKVELILENEKKQNVKL